jgi:hypothetical protein
MTRSVFAGGVPSCVCLSVMTALCLLAAGDAFARVGVTSATDGDPLGKPPNENERVLRIGIDVQANEVVTTHDNDRAHLVFLDGTSLTVGPNAKVVIDKFVYDPNTKQGELAITASQGVFRLVGGRISKTNAITIDTPSTTIGIRGGIVVGSVTQTVTKAALVFGDRMWSQSNGVMQNAWRAGSMIITNRGEMPGQPFMIPRGGLSTEFGVLETGRSSSGGSGKADQAQQNSGYNSGGSNTGNNGGFTPNTNSNILTQAIANGNLSVQGNSNSNSNPITNSTTRTTQTLNGYTNGLIREVDGERLTTIVPQVLFSRPTDVTISTNASTNQAQGTIIIRGLYGEREWYPPTVTLRFGGGNGASDFISDKNYTMSQNPAQPSTVQFGERTIALNDTANLNSSGVPMSSTAPNSSVTTNIPANCTCEFLTWGWWSAVVTNPNSYDQDKRYQVVSAPFVVGQQTTAIQMPMTGSATYNGFMTGNVQNGGSLYNATGSYSSTWSFASRAGTFNANFDGTRYYGGAIANVASGTSFIGGFVGGYRVGTLAGSFFGPGAANQAGSFAIIGPQYGAGGIFAGSIIKH